MTALALPTEVGRWLPFGVPAGTLRLYCLPHAGGSASAYRGFVGRVGRVAVVPVQLPGRETRLRDATHGEMGPLVADLADVVLADPGPYALYGHSLGALVGFELAREVARRGGPGPEHLVVSGCPAPHVPATAENPPVAGMTDAEVVGLLRTLGGTPEVFLREPSVLRMILPPVRADFSVKDTYRYEPGPALPVPVTAVASTADPRADVAAQAAWRDLTTAAFRLDTLTGGHFAVLEQPEATARHLARTLRGWA